MTIPKAIIVILCWCACANLSAATDAIGAEYQCAFQKVEISTGKTRSIPVIRRLDLAEGKINTPARFQRAPIDICRGFALRGSGSIVWILFTTHSGIPEIYKATEDFLSKDFSKEPQNLPTIDAIDTFALFTFARDHKILTCFGEYILLFVEDGVLKGVPATHATDPDKKSRRDSIRAGGVIAYNEATNSWEKSTTRAKTVSEILKRFQRTGDISEYDSLHGKFSFTDKGDTVATTLTKPDGETLSAEIPASSLPAQILEAADGTLWYRSIGDSIVRIAVCGNALVAEPPPLPFYLPDIPKKNQIFTTSISAMIKSSDGKIGIIIPAHEVGYVFDRTFFFDPTENAWFEQTLDGEMHRYDNSTAQKENEAYQKAVEERRTLYKQKHTKK